MNVNALICLLFKCTYNTFRIIMQISLYIQALDSFIYFLKEERQVFQMWTMFERFDVVIYMVSVMITPITEHLKKY